MEFILKIKEYLLFTIGALIFYIVFRLILLLIKYIIFQKLVDFLVKKAFDDKDKYSKAHSIKDEDLDQRKTKRREMEEELSQVNKIGQSLDGLNKGKFGQKIVGIRMPKILGSFTRKVVIDMAQKFRSIDPNVLQNLGYFRATELARENQRAISHINARDIG